ncbi:MAG: hypothetical protein LBK47_10055 [Prevotellaceae bacterium]|jgi:biotin operon repressor|nr:hypothetical protein [Prevotellaceae bacterium]
MKLFALIEKMELFHKLVKFEHTGTPEALALRLGISRSYLYEIIDELRARGIAIEYSRIKHSFYYKGPAVMHICFSICVQPMTEDEKRSVAGGFKVSKWNFTIG